MILLNFTHPLTGGQVARLEALTGQPVERVVQIAVQFDPARPFAGQVVQLADAAGLTVQQWQSKAILVVPPALNFIAVALLAELHGRMGYFAAHLRTRLVEGSTPPRYEVAEIMNLQEIRLTARATR